jgi:hypothetical protein
MHHASLFDCGPVPNSRLPHRLGMRANGCRGRSGRLAPSRGSGKSTSRRPGSITTLSNFPTAQLCLSLEYTQVNMRRCCSCHEPKAARRRPRLARGRPLACEPKRGSVAMPIRQYKVFIEHANGRAPARFTVPAGVTQVEVAIRARDAGFQPYHVRFDDEQGVWLVRVIDWRHAA